MDTHHTPSNGASSADAAAFPSTPATAASAHPEEGLSAGEGLSRRTALEAPAPTGGIDGHLPDRVDPLDPKHPDTAFTETKRLRHDGWTPERKRLFLERFAECGVVVEACEAAGMSARSAYNLRDRDPLFAAGWDAACVMARPKLAGEVYSRAMNGVVERIYKDGLIVAERHRYDNRLTMAALGRLDQRIDRDEERGAPHLRLVDRWDDYLAALAEDRREDGFALLAAPAAEVHEGAGDRELPELHQSDEDREMGRNDVDRHDLWEDDEGMWTDYPPPPGFDGEEEGRYGDYKYRRTLSPEEQSVIDADEAAGRAEERARGEAQRLAYFFGLEPGQDGEPGGPAGADR
jgi:hypothetical protein